jgi:hypothetical protein
VEGRVAPCSPHGGVMPYRQIHWIKLERRLLNDHRFYLMSESAQLVYIKLLMLSAETRNKIPSEPMLLKTIFRCNLTEDAFRQCLEEVEVSFPKLVKRNGFYQFKEWDNRHNQTYTKDIRGISHEYPSLVKNKKKKEEEDIRKKSDTPQAQHSTFLETLKTNPAYKHINFDIEIAKMQAWLSLPRNKGRQLTDRFILNWLNKVDKPVSVGLQNKQVNRPLSKPLPPDEKPMTEEERKKFRESIKSLSEKLSA